MYYPFKKINCKNCGNFLGKQYLKNRSKLEFFKSKILILDN